jgi:hypothetical protein
MRINPYEPPKGEPSRRDQKTGAATVAAYLRRVFLLIVIGFLLAVCVWAVAVGAPGYMIGFFLVGILLFTTLLVGDWILW